MSEDEISFYSRINKKKNNKSPILRVRIKKEQRVLNSNSTKNIDRNHLQLKIPLTTKNNLINNQRSKNTLTKFNSITYFNKDKKDTKGKINNKNIIDKIKKKKIIYRRNSFNEENTIKNNKNKTGKDLYCINCINKKMNINKNLSQYLNQNNTYEYTLQENLPLKQIDENYINNKILQNERRQLAAFNHLKLFIEKNPLSKKDKLQYIYENSEYPFHGLNLQDYLYYNNKSKNERRNKLLLKNISSKDITNPRKEINDYYNKVMFQTPLLEKDSRPSDEFKKKYQETLEKQINENNKIKKNKKNAEQNKEIKELNKYKEILKIIDEDERKKKIMKKNIIYENNNNMSNIKKEKDELNKYDVMKGYQERLKIFKERQNEYKEFINQQRINEINNLQNWIKENKKQKKEQMRKEKNEDLRWKNYLKTYNDSFNENIHLDKCAECNLVYTNRLYPLQIP